MKRIGRLPQKAPDSTDDSLDHWSIAQYVFRPLSLPRVLRPWTQGVHDTNLRFSLAGPRGGIFNT
jgi:hypothetical protein